MALPALFCGRSRGSRHDAPPPQTVLHLINHCGSFASAVAMCCRAAKSVPPGTSPFTTSADAKVLMVVRAVCFLLAASVTGDERLEASGPDRMAQSIPPDCGGVGDEAHSQTTSNTGGAPCPKLLQRRGHIGQGGAHRRWAGLKPSGWGGASPGYGPELRVLPRRRLPLPHADKHPARPWLPTAVKGAVDCAPSGMPRACMTTAGSITATPQSPARKGLSPPAALRGRLPPLAACHRSQDPAMAAGPRPQACGSRGTRGPRGQGLLLLFGGVELGVNEMLPYVAEVGGKAPGCHARARPQHEPAKDC